MDAKNEDFRLSRNAFGRLVLTDAAGREHVGVTPVRAFPIAAPQEGLSLVGPDGHELAWVDRMDALTPAARVLVEEELALREFMPRIEQLESVSSFATPSTWRVRTDRGTARFVLKAEEDIRRLPGGTLLLITSADGVQFLADRFALDKASKKLLERFL
ncbi:cyanophycin metabolism-associated DUF1854 family protein [Azohydromonas caseinilytica]|uniref:DUF1854 domain-containing protein n=1 Tax=Azohydromonas caseinilytica TaxID=2728836 RepID=A0A848F3D5_9BURK|nr:DUF1854 domain-containing protein [Azohydromonas caseinilytica]NML13568.1 DUF1854 domain-containing protein [Azohydromonas caseinilytica]